MPKKFTPLTFKYVYHRDVNRHLRKSNVKCLCQKNSRQKKHTGLRFSNAQTLTPFIKQI